jgi:hypothetical protein
MHPSSDISRFFHDWPHAKASIEESLANPFDINQGGVDPIQDKLRNLLLTAERHINSIDNLNRRENGQPPLSEFTENSHASGSSAMPQDSDSMSLAESTEGQGNSRWRDERDKLVDIVYEANDLIMRRSEYLGLQQS